MCTEFISWKHYARKYREINCYKCPNFYSGGFWVCRGRPADVDMFCTWDKARRLTENDLKTLPKME